MGVMQRGRRNDTYGTEDKELMAKIRGNSMRSFKMAPCLLLSNQTTFIQLQTRETYNANESWATKATSWSVEERGAWMEYDRTAIRNGTGPEPESSAYFLRPQL
jgi:hypothetical protein